MRPRRLERERFTSGERYFQLGHYRRGHRAGQRDFDRGANPGLGADIRGQGLELGYRFVVQPVTAAAGRLVRKERNENRQA